MSLENISKELSRAKTSIERLLKIRNRSEKEIRDRLKLKKFSTEAIETAVQYYKDLRLIDDRKFVRWWINARLIKPFGTRRIAFELKNKGVQEELIKAGIASIREEFSEDKAVEELVARRWPRYKKLDPLKRKRRLFDYLARRGFDVGTINRAIRKL